MIAALVAVLTIAMSTKRNWVWGIITPQPTWARGWLLLPFSPRARQPRVAVARGRAQLVGLWFRMKREIDRNVQMVMFA